MVNFQPPTDLKGVKGFSKIAHPLIELTKKAENGKVTWAKEAQQAFEVLKTKLTTEPIFSEEFILQTDASGFAIGPVLAQIQHGKEVVIAYASRHLNTAEKKYAAIEREALAIIFGINNLNIILRKTLLRLRLTVGHCYGWKA